MVKEFGGGTVREFTEKVKRIRFVTQEEFVSYLYADSRRSDRELLSGHGHGAGDRRFHQVIVPEYK